MERRACERIPSNLKVRFFSVDLPDSAVVTNFTRNGMCIRTSYCLPCDNSLELLIPLNKGILKLHVRIRRIKQLDDIHYALGVELIDTPEEYREFVHIQRKVFKALKKSPFNKHYRLFNYDL